MDLGLPLGDPLLLAGVLLATGFVVGLLAGLLGIGGGGILVPVLYEVFTAVGVDPAICIHLAVGTSLSVIIPTSLRSFQSHRAKGAVDMGLLKAMALPVIAGVCLGVLVARYSDDTVLKAVWAGCATLMSAKLFFGRESWRLGDTIPGNPGRALSAVQAEPADSREHFSDSGLGSCLSLNSCRSDVLNVHCRANYRRSAFNSGRD